MARQRKAKTGGGSAGESPPPTAAVNGAVKHPPRGPEPTKTHPGWLVQILKFIGYSLVFLFFILPATIIMFPVITKEIVFLRFVRWPLSVDFDAPSPNIINNTFNHRLQYSDSTGEEISLGFWHVKPTSLKNTNIAFDDKPVVLYLHGNGNTRAGYHRVQLYKKLSQFGYHIVAVDYRGYADSTGSPTEPGVNEDVLETFQWIRKRSKAPIFLWGHSLGSSVAAMVARNLSLSGIVVDGIVLEGPFNNMLDELMAHFLSKPFSVFPWFTWGFVHSLNAYDTSFKTDKYLIDVACRVMILHAEDDKTVPLELAVKLYDEAMVARKNVTLHVFEGHRGFGHKHIYRAEELEQIVRNFTG